VTERLPVKFTRRADKHVDEARIWWRENRTKAPGALAEDLEQALELISSQPHVGALARNVRIREVRRVYLNRVGYYLYYRIHGDPPTMIQVVAFWHSTRGKGPRL
jgi:hypothetical protein